MASLGPARFVNRWTQGATLVTVGSGVFVPWEVLVIPQSLFWSLCAIYACQLTVGVYLADRAQSSKALLTYFVVSTTLLGALMLAAQGWVWIVGLPLLSHVVLFASWRWALAWSMQMLGLVVLVAPPATNWLPVAMSLGAAGVFVIAFSVVARREVEWRLRSEQLSESLAIANGQLRAHAAEVAELSAMRERNRVAREVHDGLGHYLTTIHVQLEAARALLDKDGERARERVERAQLLAKQGLQDVRESVALLRHSAPEPVPLEQALSELVQSDGRDGPMPNVALDVSGDRRRVSDTVQHALKRVLQEALTNVSRHSNAKHVEVRLCFDPKQIVLDILDDGTNSGDKPNPAGALALGGSGHGLLGISERIHLLGGNATFGRTDDGGFRVKVTVPA